MFLVGLLLVVLVCGSAADQHHNLMGVINATLEEDISHTYSPFPSSLFTARTLRSLETMRALNQAELTNDRLDLFVFDDPAYVRGGDFWRWRDCVCTTNTTGAAQIAKVRCYKERDDTISALVTAWNMEIHSDTPLVRAYGLDPIFLHTYALKTSHQIEKFWRYGYDTLVPRSGVHGHTRWRDGRRDNQLYELCPSAWSLVVALKRLFGELPEVLDINKY